MVIVFFFFNDTATTEIYTLSLHDALPISSHSATTSSATCNRTSGTEEGRRTWVCARTKADGTGRTVTPRSPPRPGTAEGRPRRAGPALGAADLRPRGRQEATPSRVPPRAW